MNSSEKKTGIIYCRVSSKDQVENTSLKSQERICREYADKNNIEILQVFIDGGESAKTTNRKEFIKAISFCSRKKPKVDYFIVYKLDRFSRVHDDHVTVRAALKKIGTQLRSATETIDESIGGKVVETVLSLVAEIDNINRKEKSVNGMMERLKQGVWTWREPLGYYRPHQKLNIKPDPNFDHYIKLIFEEYAKGIYSYDSLAKFMAKRGFRTRYGKLPIAQLIEKIIKNPLYCGIIDVWDLRIKGSFEPIISEELFYKCQKWYKSKPRFERRQVKNPDFPLRRTVCLACSGSITGSYSRGRNRTRYPYYHHQKQGCINAKFIPKETFEQLFVEYLNEITPDMQYEKWFKAIMLDIWQSNYKQFDEVNGKIRKELEKLEQDRQEVFALHRKGTYSDDEFLEQKDLINSKISEKSQLMNENRIEEFDMDEALTYCFQFVRHTAESWLRLGYDNKLRFQRNVFAEKPHFDAGKFGTRKLSRIYALNQEYDGKKSQLAAPRGIEPLLPG